MAELSKFDNVRVVQLVRPNRPYGGISCYSRPPQAGDQGVVVFVYRFGAQPPAYVVAGMDAHGRTLWVADFTAEELEPTSLQAHDRAA